MTVHAFPAPDHDHSRCATDAIAHAEQVCRGRGQKLTPLRRSVLQALLASHRPLGAYEVLEGMAQTASRPAPISVYRALDFLMAQGLVHRIESRNAFLACVQDHARSTAVAFLICDQCGTAAEIDAANLLRDVTAAANDAGFTPRLAVIEVTGQCAHCRAQK